MNEVDCGTRPMAYEKRETIPQIYSGVPTFLGVPRISAPEEICGYDVAVMGAPWEGICTTGVHTGTELSVKTIRAVSLRYGGYLPEYDFDFFDELKVGDFGDSACFNGDIEQTFAAIEEKVWQIHSRGKISVCFGGDHSITIPTLRSLARLGKRVGVIHFDAHLDNLESLYGEEKNARCSPLNHAYQTPQVTKIVHIGIRGPRNHYSGLENAEKHKAQLIFAPELHRRGWEDVMKEVMEYMWKDVDLVYMTVCSDALDASTNPGGPADFGGLTSHQFLSMAHGFASKGIAAFDFVEVYPPQDPNGVSSHMAAWGAIYAMNGMGMHAAGKKQ